MMLLASVNSPSAERLVALSRLLDVFPIAEKTITDEVLLSLALIISETFLAAEGVQIEAPPNFITFIN